jgi:hypothetical protein
MSMRYFHCVNIDNNNSSKTVKCVVTVVVDIIISWLERSFINLICRIRSVCPDVSVSHKAVLVSCSEVAAAFMPKYMDEFNRRLAINL